MQTVAFWGIYPFLWLISKLPFRLLYIFSDMCYILVYKVIGYRKKTVRYNLKTAFPEKSDKELLTIERGFYHHLCDMFLEMIKSMSITKEELVRRYRFTNIEVMTQYDIQGQSACVLMGHYASYEWVFALQTYLKNSGYAIYKKIAHKQFDQLVHNIRGRWDSFLLEAKMATKKIKELEDKNITASYGFIGDQSPRLARAHFWTSFLGQELPFFTGAERTAKEFNLPILFLAVTKVKRGYYEATFQVLSETPKEVADFEITSAFAKALETQITTDPQYYLWTHKRFKLLGKKSASPASKKG